MLVRPPLTVSISKSSGSRSERKAFTRFNSEPRLVDDEFCDEDDSVAEAIFLRTHARTCSDCVRNHSSEKSLPQPLHVCATKMQ